MAYSVAADLTPWTGVLSASTKVTIAQADAIAAAHSAAIDGHLASGYTTPITGTNSLAIVKDICLHLTLADVLDILGLGFTVVQDKVVKTDHRKIANDKLKAIVEGTLALSDASRSSSGDFVNDNVDNSREFTMKKDEVQW